MWQLIISAVLAWSTVSFSRHWQHVIFSVWAIKLTSKCADRSANSLQVDINIICWLLRHACNFVWLYWLTLCGFGYHIFQLSRVLTSIEPLNKQGQIWQSLLQETLQLIDVFYFLIRISWKDSRTEQACSHNMAVDYFSCSGLINCKLLTTLTACNF